MELTPLQKLEELKKIYEICPNAMECIDYDKLKKEIEKIRFQDLKNMGFDVDRFMKEAGDPMNITISSV